MKIEITLQQFSVLKDIFELLKGIDGATSIKMHIDVDGWLGKGTADYNRHEHDAKIRIELPEKENNLFPLKDLTNRSDKINVDGGTGDAKIKRGKR